MPERSDITGLVLAGGRGSRMGGVDKGLQRWQSSTLAANALQRLRPQAGALLISANRNLEAYAAYGVPAWPDADVATEAAEAAYAGPLAGILSGARHAATPWLAVVPCDAPFFPPDLVARLAEGVARADANIAVAAIADGDQLRRQPVFCLLRTGLADSLDAYLRSGGRKAGQWILQQRCIEVAFDDARAFDNLNTADELRAAD